ncbi:MAG: hypothetical protein Q9159_004315 [Coniocarpon cinnabarinum]
MSGSYTVATQTQYSTTTTQPFISPVATGQQANVTATSAQGGGGLSGGAIAGIVIGVLLGLLLLALLIFFCCIRGLYKTFFGGGRRKRRNTTVVEETYHRSNRGGAARSNAKWYGAPPSRRVVEERKTTRRFGPGIGGAIGGAFGFGRNKRNQDRRRRYTEKSDVSSSYYSSDYTRMDFNTGNGTWHERLMKASER